VRSKRSNSQTQASVHPRASPSASSSQARETAWIESSKTQRLHLLHHSPLAKANHNNPLPTASDNKLTTPSAGLVSRALPRQTVHRPHRRSHSARKHRTVTPAMHLPTHSVDSDSKLRPIPPLQPRLHLERRASRAARRPHRTPSPGSTRNLSKMALHCSRTHSHSAHSRQTASPVLTARLPHHLEDSAQHSLHNPPLNPPAASPMAQLTLHSEDLAQLSLHNPQPNHPPAEESVAFPRRHFAIQQTSRDAEGRSKC
jgi:hypothetical protein